MGIDIGGTFTDVVLLDTGYGTLCSHKELTTSSDPAAGVAAALRVLFTREDIAPRTIGRVVHATTLFTNALIERKGALIGLITTQGFRDVLEIARERKYELYDIFIDLPRPLVSRDLRLEVPERLGPDGAVVVPLDTGVLVEQVQSLVMQGVESVAVAFLHAYASPVHERQAKDVLARHFAGLNVSISSDVAPEIREYERSSTTVANAYVAPMADRYLQQLVMEMSKLGVEAELFLMLSNGGLTHVAEARRRPIQMLESGPAAGALAGAYFGMRSGLRHVLAFDMGGTTAKLSVVEDGQPVIGYGFEAARTHRFVQGSGLPISISAVELIEIGAGGGSVVSLDELGLLKVGPRSAGSAPGPACYGRGGTEPTVTDANLLLGYLDPEFFAGGTLPLSKPAAKAAVGRLADKAGLSGTDAAGGIIDLVNETMAGAARVHIAECGQDPRRYALLVTGGGGPLHGCAVARKLGISTLVCPPSAGVASALGLLVAPARIDRVATVDQPVVGTDWVWLEARFVAMEADALTVIAETGIDPAMADITRLADMRFIGQGFQLVVRLPGGPYGDTAEAEIQRRFQLQYETVYGRTPARREVEFVNIRVSVQAPAGAAELCDIAGEGGLAAARKGSRPAWFAAAHGFVDTPVYDRLALGAGCRIAGPALVEEADATLLLPPACEAVVQANGNILVSLS